MIYAVYPDAERLDLGTNTPVAWFKYEHDAHNFGKGKYGKFYIVKIEVAK